MGSGHANRPNLPSDRRVTGCDSSRHNHQLSFLEPGECEVAVGKSLTPLSPLRVRSPRLSVLSAYDTRNGVHPSSSAAQPEQIQVPGRGQVGAPNDVLPIARSGSSRRSLTRVRRCNPDLYYQTTC